MKRLTCILLSILMFILGSGFIRPRELRMELTGREKDLIVRLMMAEASGEDLIGKALIACVVLNRLEDGRYGDSVEEVIYAQGQFYTAGMFQEPTPECYEALDIVLYGWDGSRGALYFCATGYNGAVPLFKHGGHYFSKRELSNERYQFEDRIVRQEVS